LFIKVPQDTQLVYIFIAKPLVTMSTPQAKSAPNVNLPKGSQTCEISIINTTCDIVVPPGTLVEPKIPGHEYLNLPTVAFYIKHASGAELLFDMGCRSDWENLVPHVSEIVSERVPGLRVSKDVPVILKEGGVDPNKLKALILSHWCVDSMSLSRFL
jgi:hypothetical protein